jgi:glucan phosphoethanolaminetransferase (alkaline phosphatase superfamily)
VVVVVIGESARADHFHINGYERETTPLLEKRKNIVNFPLTTSCDVWTLISVPCILTRGTEANHTLINRETSFISLFRKLGFNTVWLSAQGGDPVMFDILTAISAEANEEIRLKTQTILDETVIDEQLLPLIERTLHTQTKPLLMIVHTIGNHWWYADRYPAAFERFPAMEFKGKDHTRYMINSYDNSILYTDYVLDQILSRLEKKNAIFVYTSDHGESLGENGKWTHGHDSPEVRHVPMVWWASDAFISHNKERWNALVHKASLPSSHDVIFHSILECVGVVSPTLIQPSLSLCNLGHDK